MTKVSGDWINQPGTQQVLSALGNAGYQALFVGGCVRNALLGAPVNDIDIATDATPDRVIKICQGVRLKTIPTGLDHGTVTVIAGGCAHEVTTFRQDEQTFGRHAKVAFTTALAKDAGRRDFTMNALYADAQGNIVDPLGGLDDVLARRVRFIRDPGDRIQEDFLRILRFFRFHAWYADPDAGIDADGLAACAAYLGGIDTLSRERVGAEMLKLLAAPDPCIAVAAMAHSGCLARVLPGADHKALAVLISFEQEFGVVAHPIRRLAVLGGEDVMARLRLSRVQNQMLDLFRANLTGDDAKGLGHRFGAERGRDILLLRAALLGTPPARAMEDDLEAGAAAEFPLSGEDLMPGFTGAELGQVLGELRTSWIKSGFQKSRADLLKEASSR